MKFFYHLVWQRFCYTDYSNRKIYLTVLNIKIFTILRHSAVPCSIFDIRCSLTVVCHYCKKPKLRVVKPIPDFADEVTDINWRLEDLFSVKKKRHVNPGMTEAGQNKLTMMAKSNRILPS